MANQDYVKPGCFSGFNLRELLGRRKQPIGKSTRSKPMTPSCCQGEWSLNPAESLPPYTPCLEPFEEKPLPAFTPEVIESIESKLDELDSSLRELSLKIHARPELGFQEHFAHDVLTSFLESHNFSVTRHYAELSTAWRAEYTSTSCATFTSKRVPVLGINSEMDALPGIGHGCGHNLIAICGVGIALAVRYALERHHIAGRIILLGTPAEESGGGKIILLERGAYKDMDVCLMSHPIPGPTNSAVPIQTTALRSVTVEYFGKTAHAGQAPWEGKNALDAAVIAYTTISALRQQIKPTTRVHGIIEGRDWVDNIIPGYSKLTYCVRAPTKTEVEDTYPRVERCFQAAALATGCEVKINTDFTYYDVKQNSVLGRANDFAANVQTLYGTRVLEATLTGASTDFGNISYDLPSLHPAFAIPTEPDGGNHTIGFARSSITTEAHTATIRVTKGLALTGFRVLADKKFLEQVKGSF